MIVLKQESFLTAEGYDDFYEHLKNDGIAPELFNGHTSWKGVTKEEINSKLNNLITTLTTIITAFEGYILDTNDPKEKIGLEESNKTNIGVRNMLTAARKFLDNVDDVAPFLVSDTI
jgi:hypothetical protein